MIHCTSDSSKRVLLSVKAIREVVSGVLLMQTSIFIQAGYKVNNGE
jgi:hypothetical protein